MKLYNTLSRKVEDFAPADDVVKIYVCGITPYSRAHVGHALRSVVFDVLRRYLEYSGLEVRHVENFTDVDDKMIDGAAQQGTTVRELADRNVETYLQEMDALNVLRAHVYPKATEEVAGMVEIIDDLVRKEAAYVADGDVYFSVRQRPDYGKLSRRSVDSMIAGARVEVGERKRDDMDFALWKSQKPGEPAWDSPWGPGRPGWHIECSAMSAAHLGKTLDIHGGGQDLIFPHHENELAQSESYTDGVQLARFWLHNGMLRVDDNKMGKSLGNTISVEEALDAFSPDALRLFFLSSHYRSPLTFSEQAVEAQERAAGRLRNALDAVDGPTDGPALDPQPYRDRFVEAMDDDLSTPRALAALFDAARDINRGREDGLDVRAAQGALRELSGVLGLTLREPIPAGSADIAPFVQLLVDTRLELRNARRYDLADGIRDRLADLGVAVEDTLHGSEWRRIRK
jgi:cysteinyl-tRNA synthetase